MAEIGTAHITVTSDTERVEAVLRVIAKHAIACADELAALRDK